MRTLRYEVPDIAEVPDVRTVRPLVRAVAGGHNMLITAHPGVGPTMLARRIPKIMAPLSDHQARWLRAEYDAAGLLSRGCPVPAGRPLRTPHHTVSEAALVGTRAARATGRANARRAGELQLARFGVLYLDELVELRRATVRSLAACGAR